MKMFVNTHKKNETLKHSELYFQWTQRSCVIGLLKYLGHWTGEDFLCLAIKMMQVKVVVTLGISP